MRHRDLYLGRLGPDKPIPIKILTFGGLVSVCERTLQSAAYPA
jgi:hypothetical protein